ncbi:MAG TPA: serine/threonine-protein kinase [Kofleriaceae bacterium]
MSACVSAEELALYAGGGSMPEADRARIEEHIARCDRCREAVSVLAAVELGATAEGVAPTWVDTAPGSLAAVERGAASAPPMGRFQLTRHLGRGAMGDVWAAHDPELDRDVALKFLGMRAQTLSDNAGERMRREAQAMARLSHPNVVAIHELCEVDGQIFCAMQLVDGKNLRSWLGTPRTWQEIATVMLDAGRGLAAAHRAGLVHRDVKPENILIAADGRALVSDFGLAKLVALDRERGQSAAVPDGASPLAAGITETGALLGTPAYMSPEQLEGGAVGARSDQFAWCVTFYEALFGSRPFTGATVEALVSAVRARPVAPGRRGAPRGLVSALLRGLAADQVDRWPSMDALVATIERAVGAPRRRRLVIAAAAVLGAAVAAVLFLSSRTGGRDQVADVRSAAASRIARAWGDRQRAELAAGLRATAYPAADEMFAAVTRALDGYRDGWLAMRVDAWAATHLRGEQNAEMLERRLDCLDRLADQLGATVTALTAAEREQVPGALQAVAQLTPTSICADRDRLLAMVAPEESPAAATARAALDEVLALSATGRHEEAMRRARPLASQVEHATDPALAAHGLYILGAAKAAAGEPDAEGLLRRAVQAAAVIRDHHLVAASWVRLVGLLAERPDRRADALALAPAASAAVEQAGGDPLQRSNLELALGVAENESGNLAQARDHLLAARKELAGQRGGEALRLPLQLARIDVALAGALAKLNELDQATEVLQRAIATVRQAVGPRHPVIANALNTLTIIARIKKDAPRAERLALESLELARALFPPGNSFIVTGHQNLADVRLLQGRLADARAELAAARAELARAKVPDAAELARLDLRICSLAQQGPKDEVPRSEAACRKAADAVLAALGPDHPTTAIARAHLALAIEGNRPGEALELYSDGLRILSLHPEQLRPAIPQYLAGVGRAALAAHKPEVALTWFQRHPASATDLREMRTALERMRARRH